MANLVDRRFGAGIYTLKVGSAQHVFTVHKDVLCLSPILACMTMRSSSEDAIKEIMLPEDDADNFGRILEHLYGNNDAAFEVDLLDFDGAAKLADMYMLAEKYQLHNFKARVIEKLQLFDVLREDRMAFFKIASKICLNTAESDDIFMPYFFNQASKHLKSLTMEEADDLSEMIWFGGSFAKKIFQLLVILRSQSG